MRILDLIRQGGYTAVSVVGLAKNAGKTVALNSIIGQSAAKGISLGLSSIGYDGEKIDILSRLAKPRISVREGTILATAAATIERATASLELLAATNFVTALGEVMLVRARESGNVEIAGPDSLAEMRECISLMKGLGCDLVLVDGALDRVGSAAPTITEAAIVSTGAVAGANMRRILTRTLHTVSLFSLQELGDAQLRQKTERVQHLGHLALADSHDFRPLPFKSALGHATAVVDHLVGVGPFSLFIPGALTDSLLSELNHKPRVCKNARLICPDPTHIFCSPEVWQKFWSLGGRVEVLRRIKVLAVTVNPTAPSGKSYAPREFAREMAEALAPLPVYDLFLSEENVCV